MVETESVDWADDRRLDSKQQQRARESRLEVATDVLQ